MSSGAPWCQHLCRFSDVPPRSLMSCRSFHDPCHERPVWLCRAGDCRSTCAPPSPRRSWSSDGTSGARMASLLQRLGEHLLDLLISNGARPPRPRLVRQPLQPIDQKPRAPLRHRSARQLQFLRHLRDGPALSTRQHDPRPQRQRLRRLPPPRPPHQHRTFLAGQHHWIKLRLGITRVY